MTRATCGKCNVTIVPEAPESRIGKCPSCGMLVGRRHVSALHPNCVDCGHHQALYPGAEPTCRPGHMSQMKLREETAVRTGEIRCRWFEARECKSA